MNINKKKIIDYLLASIPMDTVDIPFPLVQNFLKKDFFLVIQKEEML